MDYSGVAPRFTEPGHTVEYDLIQGNLFSFSLTSTKFTTQMFFILLVRMNCVVIFADVKLKKNRFPRINLPSDRTVHRVDSYDKRFGRAWRGSYSLISKRSSGGPASGGFKK